MNRGVLIINKNETPNTLNIKHPITPRFFFIKETVDKGGGFQFYILNGDLYDNWKARKGKLTFDYAGQTVFIGSSRSVSASYEYSGTKLTVKDSKIAGLKNGTFYKVTDEAAEENSKAVRIDTNKLLKKFF